MSSRALESLGRLDELGDLGFALDRAEDLCTRQPLVCLILRVSVERVHMSAVVRQRSGEELRLRN
jgi:hypothetical protein